MAKPSKAKALERLRRALDAIPELRELQDRSSSPELKKWRRNTEIAITNTFGEDSRHIEDFKRIPYVLRVISRSTRDYERQQAYLRGLESAAAILESMIEEIEEYWEPVTAKGVLEALSTQEKEEEEEEEEEEENQTSPSFAAQENERTNTNEVFVIHGRDNEVKETVARFLERLDLEPIILAEQPGQGRTIIDKFEQHAQVGFAVALLTPDDAGSLQNDGNTLNPRARQNVIFELGFFIGKLGRKGVRALTKGEVEIPSDYAGVEYIPFDDGGGWKLRLVRELQSAGYNVDANKAL